MAAQHFDFLVIGAGSGGIRASLEASKLGLSVCLAEKHLLGGTCMNAGCIPTKYLLGSTASLPMLETQTKLKNLDGHITVNLGNIQERKERYVKGLRQAVSKQLEAAGVTVIRGAAVFTGPQTVLVSTEDGEREISFTRCAAATGSIPASFPGIEPDGKAVLTSTELLGITAVPQSMIVIGAGAIGIELGEFFHRLGCRITLVEAAPRILPTEDEEVSALLHRHFSRAGWDIHVGRKIKEVKSLDSSAPGRALEARVTFEDGEALTADLALAAVGRKPSDTDLGAEKGGLSLTERGWLKADQYLMCSPYVYAIGDANGQTLLAHAADHQARYVARHAAGLEAGPYAPPAMPSCVYGTMEVMRVGPTPRQLRDDGGKVVVSRAALAANAISQSYGHTQGFVKISWKDDRIASVTAIGHGVSHLAGASSFLLASHYKKTTPFNIIIAHPTLDETLESAMFAEPEDYM